MQNNYFRPTNRGSLVAKLRDGVSCEVIADNAETTCMLIDGWLNPPSYTVHPSKNEGWVVFKPDSQSLQAIPGR